MQCGAKSNLRALHGDAWRIVEDQHESSTQKLVNTPEEQSLLEEMLDSVKPSLHIQREEFKGLHYLLFSPFRYPPLKYGSRFGTREERSLWYGSESLETAFAEVAYYRFLFAAGPKNPITLPIDLRLMAYDIPYSSKVGVDLTREPFLEFSAVLASKSEYRATQQLGTEMRNEGVEVIRFLSARDPLGGVNVGIYSPRAFGVNQPQSTQTWRASFDTQKIVFTRIHNLQRCYFHFFATDFNVDGVLPRPAT
jgi:hypothetical protein